MCTDFLLQAVDGSLVVGRSMEFGQDLGSQILVVGKGTEMQGNAPDFGPGLRWTTQYGYVGLNTARDQSLVTDGMNAAGLSIGALWLPVSTYARTVANTSQALRVDLFTGWVLGNFSTVGDVRQALNEVEVWGNDFLQAELPVHFSIHDTAGCSIVVEFMNGQTQVYDNPVAVTTNAPPFPWHLTNIGTYVGLAALDAAPTDIEGYVYQPPGHGSGMRGLPGDSTPPSRFIRTVFQKQFATQPADNVEACSLALHLLNTVDIPLGTSQPQNTSDGNDYTQWAVVKSLSERTFSYRTYDNPTVMQIDLRTLPALSSPGETPYPMPSEPAFIDITGKLQAQ
ncbi:MAG TPA: choloylglycine hydrolase family protein [Inquilinus sp.]